MSTAILERNVSSNDTVIDLLDRQPFIDQMLQIAEKLSRNRKNACYALNGAWGVGKSFVIKEFESQIVQYGQDDTTLNRFLLFHYDCWKYDYYAEPLTAIISVMLETIESDVRLLSDDTRVSIISTLKAIGVFALDHFDKRIERKTGISPKDVYEAIVNAKSDILAQIEESHEFDSYYAIKATLNRLRDVITALSNHQTILLMVDELDRCLPEYTIKVLERLHHVFEGIPNVQIILATDKNQLGHIVKQIYGDDTSVEKYLEKFIQFELSLTEGSINEKFDKLFTTYTTQFTENMSQYDALGFIQMLFDGIDIRTRIAIINRCELIHSLLPEQYPNNTNAHMCAEVLMVTIKHFKIRLPNDVYSNILSMDSPNDWNYQHAKQTGIYTLNNEWKKGLNSIYYNFGSYKECNISTIYGLMLACLWEMNEIKNVSWVQAPLHLHDSGFRSYIKLFWKYLSIIH